MFHIFANKTPEKLAVQELKRLRKLILKKGGPEVGSAKVCFEYWKFLEKHTMFQNFGIVAEEHAPYPKMVAILSSLDLLNSWKNTSDDDPAIKDLMELLSRAVYIAALLSFDHEELTKLHIDAGGITGRITVDPAEATAIEKALRVKIAEKKNKAEAAWLAWKETEFDLFDAIKKA